MNLNSPQENPDQALIEKQTTIKKYPIVGFIEFLGRHPFATGLFAIIGFVGFIYSILDSYQSGVVAEKTQIIAGDTYEKANTAAEKAAQFGEGLQTIQNDNDKTIEILLEIKNSLRTGSPLPSIYDLPYSEARKLLTQAGWIPMVRRWQDIAEEMDFGNTRSLFDNDIWEVYGCSGTGLSHCKMLFHDGGGRYLQIITKGEASGNDIQHVLVHDAVIGGDELLEQ